MTCRSGPTPYFPPVATDARAFPPVGDVVTDHEVFWSSGGYAYRCPAWGMTWYFRHREDAAYFLAGHLAYPVAPCAGGAS